MTSQEITRKVRGPARARLWRMHAEQVGVRVCREVDRGVRQACRLQCREELLARLQQL